MSQPTDPDTPPAKAKGTLFKKLTIAVILLGAGGGGGAYGLLAAGVIGSPDAAPVDHRPKLLRKGDVDPYAPPAPEGESEGGEAGEESAGGSPWRVAYYSFADEFTSNLKDSDALVQLSLAASTRRDGRVLQWLKKHELAIRSAVLVVLADTPEQGIDTAAGKAQLQQRLTAAINDVLTRNEGFGGVDNVYFKSFLVQ